MSDYKAAVKVIKAHFDASTTAVVLNDYFTNVDERKLRQDFPHPDYNIFFFRGIWLMEKL
jgi:hypothetical protein